MPAAQRDYGAHLYVMAMTDCVKIGRSSNPQRRLKEIRQYMPMFSTELLCTYEAQGWQEKRVHRAMRDAQVGTSEWFRMPVEEALALVQRTLVPPLGALWGGMPDLAKFAYTGLEPDQIHD